MNLGYPLFAAAAWLLFAGCLSAREAAPRPNVLFIAVDDLRPAIGAYGDALARTPNLDRLAASGALFESAYCQQAVCHPSRASLLTGLRPDSTGIYDLVTPVRSRLPDVVTLPQRFRQHGYRVVGRGKIFHGGLDDPLSWDSPPHEGRPLKGRAYASPANREPETPAEEGKPRARRPPVERADVPDNAYADGLLAEQAVSELGALAASGEPFFYAVGFFKPHLPFCAPEKYWAMHDPERLWPPPNRSLPAGTPAWVSQPAWELRNAYDVPRDHDAPLGDRLEKELRHGYYAATSYVDAQIGKVLDALAASGLDRNTVVVLWGDHGYHVGDHGTWCKHTNFEVAVRAALLVRAPGFPAGTRVARAVELIDLYPTLAALCGLPPPPGLEGESLVPLLSDPRSEATKGYAFSQYPRGSKEKPLMGYSVRRGRWRYTEWIRTDTGAVEFRELYHLGDDPHVSKNVADEPANGQTVAELSALLAKAGRGVGEARARAR